MTDLGRRLERLGLSQYVESFMAEGFDTWETVLDITESDLNYLNVKLGHRRKLQRAIAESRGQPPEQALVSEHRKVSSIDGLYRSDDSGAEPRDGSTKPGNRSASSAAGSFGTGTKRKYRRHPKPDTNAPERPPSAYVIFSNQIREELKGRDLSFTEIAKIVGERWQILSTGIRDTFETQANTAKEKYYAQLSEYKKTPSYSQYQEYLVEFKAKHGTNRIDGKRSRTESEVGSSSVDVSQAKIAQQNGENFHGGIRSSGSSPPSVTQIPMQPGFQRPSASVSPAVHSDSLNSPARLDQYSPDTTSGASSVAFRSKDYIHTSRGTPVEPIIRNPPPLQAQRSSSSQSASYSPQSGYRPDNWSESSHGNYLGSLSRRESRGSPPLPSLVHQESTLSGESLSGGTLPPPSSLLPVIDPTKPGRTLPQPVPAVGPRTSPLDPRGPAMTNTLPPITSTAPQDPTRSSNWPALLRATELAREAALRGGESKDPASDHAPPPGS